MYIVNSYIEFSLSFSLCSLFVCTYSERLTVIGVCNNIITIKKAFYKTHTPTFACVCVYIVYIS